MIVPNYVPDPLEVPENITLEPYRVRVWFIRQFFRKFLVSVGALWLVVQLPWPQIGLPLALGAASLFTLLLSLERLHFRGKKEDVVFSRALLPFALVADGVLLRTLGQMGYPVWAPIIGVLCLWLFAELSGPDFSFVGQCVLVWIASSALIAGLALLIDVRPHQVWWSMAINAGMVLYVVYDSASLLSRRRSTEGWAAVADVYRDFLNIFGYVPRVILHWRKHKIFSIPVRYSRH